MLNKSWKTYLVKNTRFIIKNTYMSCGPTMNFTQIFVLEVFYKHRCQFSKNGKPLLESKRGTNFHVNFTPKFAFTLRQRNVEIRALERRL